RSMAVDVKIMLANGVDPLAKQRQEDEERERQKAEETRVTFAAVTEKFIAKKLVGLRSAKLIEQVIRRDILSQSWSRKSITAVSKDDILSTFHVIRTNKDRTTPGQWSAPAVRVFNYVNRVMAWALTKDEFGLAMNPCTRIDLAEEMNAPKRPARE